jgi:hypothetical protein
LEIFTHTEGIKYFAYHCFPVISVGLGFNADKRGFFIRRGGDFGEPFGTLRALSLSKGSVEPFFPSRYRGSPERGDIKSPPTKNQWNENQLEKFEASSYL